jgi:hypothetical protein
LLLKLGFDFGEQANDLVDKLRPHFSRHRHKSKVRAQVVDKRQPFGRVQPAGTKSTCHRYKRAQDTLKVVYVSRKKDREIGLSCEKQRVAIVRSTSISKRLVKESERLSG